MKKIALGLLATCATATAVLAQPSPGAKVPGLAKGAQTVVVATIMSVTPAWDTNQFGDRLIMSHAELHVEETLKGNAPQVLSLDVEGGTIGELKLSVSDMPTVAPGERGVFFVRQTRPGVNVPSGRGEGILKLDATNHVLGNGLTLADVKRLVQQGVR
jgi:hypothetical protein